MYNVILPYLLINRTKFILLLIIKLNLIKFDRILVKPALIFF